MRRRDKVLLLLLLPVFVLVGGALFNIPHSGKAAFFIFLFYIVLGNFFGTDKLGESNER